MMSVNSVWWLLVHALLVLTFTLTLTTQRIKKSYHNGSSTNYGSAIADYFPCRRWWPIVG